MKDYAWLRRGEWWFRKTVSYNLTLAIIFLLALSTESFGQNVVADAGFIDSARDVARQYYDSTIAGSARIYNGTEYYLKEVQDNDVGFAYYLSPDWTKGTVTYDGVRYPSAYLLYDLVSEKVVVENPYTSSRIELVSDKVSEFTMANHSFVRLVDNSSSVGLPHSGFYEVLYDGKSKVFVKHSKEIVKKLENGAEKRKFNDARKYFIFSRGQYYAVSSKSSVLNVFRDRKTELRHVALHSGGDRQATIIELATAYDGMEEKK